MIILMAIFMGVLAYFIHCKWNVKVLKIGLLLISVILFLMALSMPTLLFGIFFILIGYVSMAAFFKCTK